MRQYQTVEKQTEQKRFALSVTVVEKKSKKKKKIIWK